jgi:hypothetical protein
MTELRAERCFGLFDVLETMFLLGLLGLTLLITLTIQIYKIIKRQQIKHRVTTVAVCLLLTTLSIMATYAPHDYFQPAAILTAELSETLYIGQLSLRSDSTYSALYGHVDWSCVTTGNYKIHEDTIFLENKVVLQSDSIFSRRYLIKEDSYLLPLDRSDYLVNKDYWLKIK